MKTKIQNLIRGEKGDAVIAIPFAILISMILMLISVSIFQAYSIRNNLQTASNEILQIIKVENGADSSTKAKFDTLLRKMDMDPNKVQFSGTPKLVQRGDPVEVTASQDYHVFALKAVGVDYTVKISVKATGLAHKFIR